MTPARTRKKAALPDDGTGLDSYNYLDCRDLRHHWIVDGWYMGADDRMRRRLHCRNCPVIATETYEGWVTRRTYTYPDDYHLDFRPSMSEIRQEQRARAGKVHRSLEALEDEVEARQHTIDLRDRRRSRSRARTAAR